MQKIGVSQKIVIFNKKGNFLVLHRTFSAPANPNKWDLPGGDLDFGEDAIEGIVREVKEEVGLEIKGLKPFDVESHINEKGEFWITIAYRARATSDEVILSFEHDEYRWVTPKEFMHLESLDKLKRFVKNLNQNKL